LGRLLRKIDPPRWVTTGKHLKWLAAGEYQANALRDLNTQNNRLSLYELDADESNLHRTIAALASLQYPGDFGYVLLDQEMLVSNGFILDPSEPGTTRDPDVDSKHVDIAELTGSALHRLAILVVQSHRTDADEDDVRMYIRTSIENGYIDRSHVKSGWG
jgi:hypothetical protein